MNLSNYKNEDGVIIFSASSTEAFASLQIDGDKQKMTLIKGEWKTVTTANGVEIIEYSDSEGNHWDTSYGTAFPYTYETLDRELMGSIQNFLSKDANDLEASIAEIESNLTSLTEHRRERIIQDLKSDVKELRKLVSRCEDYLNPRTYEGEEDCDVMCESPSESYGSNGSLTRLLR